MEGKFWFVTNLPSWGCRELYSTILASRKSNRLSKVLWRKNYWNLGHCSIHLQILDQQPMVICQQYDQVLDSEKIKLYLNMWSRMYRNLNLPKGHEKLSGVEQEQSWTCVSFLMLDCPILFLPCAGNNLLNVSSYICDRRLCFFLEKKLSCARSNWILYDRGRTN